jgi:hypothetical protein
VPLNSAHPTQDRAGKNFPSPDEVIARALDLLDDDQFWSPDDKADLDRHLSVSLAAAERGQLYTAEQARSLFTERLAHRCGGRVRASTSPPIPSTCRIP